MGVSQAKSWFDASWEPTMCSLIPQSTSRWEACTDPGLLLARLHIPALQHPFHLAGCMLAAGQGPGLTNRTQISASHLPQGSSLELILASAALQWWEMLLHVYVRGRSLTLPSWMRAAHHSSNAAGVSEYTSTSFVSLRGKQSVSRVSQKFHFILYVYIQAKGNRKE